MTLAFIIFGWPRRTKDYGPAYYTECMNCGNAAMYWLIKVRRWFTLYFIPVLPISTKSCYLVCEVCEAAIKVDKDEFANAKKATKYVKQLDAGELTEGECFDELNRLLAESELFGVDA